MTGGSVTVAPATAGTYTYTLTCTGNGGSAAAAAALAVSSPAAPAPSPTGSPASLTFTGQIIGTVSAPQTVTVTNGGSTALGSVSVSVSGDFAQTNDCTASLGAAASCSVSVTFTPTAVGNRSGTLAIASNASVSPLTVPLSGTGSNTSSSTAMALISRGLPIAASSAQYPASGANDDDYESLWRSNGASATLALDLSTVPVAQRQSIWLVW